MTDISHSPLPNQGARGVGFVLIGVLAITINDVIIKHLSGDYPLLQTVFVRSLIGVLLSLPLVKWEGGWALLRTRRPFLHILRGLLIVVSSLAFFTSLSVLSLAEATALFFVAPLLITALSVPILGEKVGLFRISAVATGFMGVLIMLQPWDAGATHGASVFIRLLPVMAASAYALYQILTRKLGASSKASAMAVYVQSILIVVALIAFLAIGDGRYAAGSDDPTILLLLRAWTWPQGIDWLFLAGLGLLSAIIGYTLAQGYRLADAATAAPFEYVGLPLAVLWGWLFWGEIPRPTVWLGILLIMGGGLAVLMRERRKKRRLLSGRGVRRPF